MDKDYQFPITLREIIFIIAIFILVFGLIFQLMIVFYLGVFIVIFLIIERFFGSILYPRTKELFD